NRRGRPNNTGAPRSGAPPPPGAPANGRANRSRTDARRPYVFKTTDFGATWQSIAANLPADGPVHVIRESSRNRDLLFVGTEFALFASLDGGGSWHRIKAGLPTVAMHDLVIHPRDRELVIGTHGR